MSGLFAYRKPSISYHSESRMRSCNVCYEKFVTNLLLYTVVNVSRMFRNRRYAYVLENIILCHLGVNSVKLSSPFRTNERPCNKFRFKIDFLDLFTVVLMLQSHEIENYAHPDIRLFKLSPKI